MPRHGRRLRALRRTWTLLTLVLSAAAQEPPASRPDPSGLSATALRAALAAAERDGDDRARAVYGAFVAKSDYEAGDYAAAVERFTAVERALLAEPARRRDELADVRSHLAMSAYLLGMKEAALAACDLATADAEAAWGPLDARTAGVRLLGVAALLRFGRIPDAEASMLAALDASGTTPAQRLSALNSLVEARLAFGRSSEARAALAAVDTTLPSVSTRESALRARAASLRGNFESSVGRTEDARAYFALQIRELEADPRHDPGDLAVAYAYLARADLRDGRLDGAEAGYRRALALLERAPEDPRRLGILLDAARTAAARRDRAALGEHADSALRLAEGPPLNVGARARALQSLAVLRHLAGDPGAAVALCDRALVDFGRAEASVAQFAALAYETRARALTALGRKGDATTAWRDAAAAMLAHVRRLSDALSEGERLSTARMLRRRLDGALSFALESGVGTAGFADGLTAWKGRVARALRAERARLRLRDEPELADARARLAAVERRIGDTLSARGERLRAAPEAVAEREALERILVRASAAADPPPPSAADVVRALAPDEALVDYVAYERDDPTDPAPPPFGEERLLAVVYRPGRAPAFVPLGAYAPVRDAVDAHVRATSKLLRPDAPTAQFAGVCGAAARAAVWAPVEPHLRGARRVWVSPDAAVAALPFETLPASDPRRALLEEFEFVYVPSAADRALRGRSDSRPTTPVGRSLLVGAPAFAGSTHGGTNARFAALPGTQDEIDAVFGALIAAGGAPEDALRLAGADATESRFKAAVKGRRIVHVATHGIFRERVAEEDPAARRIGFVSVDSAAAALPALASAVVFAEAGGPPGAEDGLLTAAEAAWLDLSACDLFVLSGCDSGRGVARAGESVLGLRRALALAGARASVTALWKTDDAASASLFADFYARLLVRGAGEVAALREAKLAALRSGRSESHPHGLPGAWGPFVLEEP